MNLRDKLFKKPTDNLDPNQESLFQKYNLKELPFPSQPYINKNSDDARYNGKIYAKEIRRPEYDKIEANFLKVPQSDMNHIRLGFIMDTSYIGRGNGKTAFCVHLNDAINKKFCLDVSNDVNKCFSVYLTPDTKGKTKTFTDVSDRLFYSLIDSDIIKYALAMLRVDAILKVYPKFDFDQSLSSDDDFLENLSSSAKWFKDNGVSISEITREILSSNFLKDVAKDFPLFGDRKEYNYVGITSQDEFKKYYEGLKKSQEKYDFIFNDLVGLFMSSGFNGGFVILDDFERIPYHQSEKQKRDFALDLRTNLFDGISLNAKVGFYNFILIFHAGVPRLIEKAWGNSGMEQRCPVTNITKESNHVIFFDKMNTSNAVLMIRKHLDEYRIDKSRLGGNALYPFNEDAIKTIGELSEFNASQILRNANQVLDRAAHQGDVEEITSSFVKKILNPEEQEVDSTGDSLGNEKHENLMKKAQEKHEK